MEGSGFKVGPAVARLKGTYPRPAQLRATAEGGVRERVIVARLWVAEGIPYAFRECPALYEEIRSWLAEGLKVDAKEISIAGSGRIGYSLTKKEWGRCYNSTESDLDFFAVSGDLFDRLTQDFERWKGDYDSGTVRASGRERRFWPSNRDETPANIQRGFIGSLRVPNEPQYGHFRAMNRRLRALDARLKVTQGAPSPSKETTLRCYRDWDAFERQVALSLQTAVR